jgi:hypothetical protein
MTFLSNVSDESKNTYVDSAASITGTCLFGATFLLSCYRFSKKHRYYKSNLIPIFVSIIVIALYYIIRETVINKYNKTNDELITGFYWAFSIAILVTSFIFCWDSGQKP